MIRTLILGFVLLLPQTVRAGDATLPDGNWRLAQITPNGIEFPIALIKIEAKDGGLAASLLDAPPKSNIEVNGITSKGDSFTIQLTITGRKATFQGLVAGKDATSARGSLAFGDIQILKAKLTATDDEKLKNPGAAKRPQPPEPFAKVNQLNSAITKMLISLQSEKDPTKRVEMIKELNAAKKEAVEKSLPLLRETVEHHADSSYALDAAIRLMSLIAKIEATPREIATWDKLIAADAALYGPRYAGHSALLFAENLVSHAKYAALAAPTAESLVAELKDDAPPARQSRILKLAYHSLSAAGKSVDAKLAFAKLAKVEAILDAEYRKTVPPFMAEAYAGRSDPKANRVAVMELFTGAQCPPCVAADVAFDVLGKTYKDSEVVLIQYHMHIPGPDPLTNPSSIARWDYYRKHFDKDVRGTPTSIFNGKILPGGGGSMAGAEKKYKQYGETIEPTLAKSTTLKIVGDAHRKGDAIRIQVDLSGIMKPDENLKLRFVLVEESIRYLGGNALRFHHQVVRALPGGAAGFSLESESFKKAVDLDVAELRQDLSKYLVDFSQTTAFPNLDRPLDLNHLRVIALVQDDRTAEILHAAQFEVKSAK